MVIGKLNDSTEMDTGDGKERIDSRLFEVWNSEKHSLNKKLLQLSSSVQHRFSESDICQNRRSVEWQEENRPTKTKETIYGSSLFPQGLAHRLWWMMMKYRVLFRFGMAKKKLTRIGRHFPFGMVSTGYYPGKVINNTNRIDLLSRGEPTEGSHGKLDDPPRDCPVFLFVP